MEWNEARAEVAVSEPQASTPKKARNGNETEDLPVGEHRKATTGSSFNGAGMNKWGRADACGGAWKRGVRDCRKDEGGLGVGSGSDEVAGVGGLEGSAARCSDGPVEPCDLYSD